MCYDIYCFNLSVFEDKLQSFLLVKVYFATEIQRTVESILANLGLHLGNLFARW